MTSKVISPLSPGVDRLRLHLNQPESSLIKNINITHNSPSRNANLRNQPKHWTVVNQGEGGAYSLFQKTRSSHKSKSLACHGGLDSFSVGKSLTKTCMSQNCFISVLKFKKLQHMTNPCFPLWSVFLLLLMVSQFSYSFYLHQKQTSSVDPGYHWAYCIIKIKHESLCWLYL